MKTDLEIRRILRKEDGAFRKLDDVWKELDKRFIQTVDRREFYSMTKERIYHIILLFIDTYRKENPEKHP